MRSKYKKIKVYRMSKLPVNTNHLEAYKNEWRNEYDKLWEANRRDMKALEIKSDELEQRLIEKYPNVSEWDWETSQRNWKYLTKKYGPISIASAENGQLIYLIMDQI